MNRSLVSAISSTALICLISGCGKRPLGLNVFGDPDAIGATVCLNGEVVAVLKPTVVDHEFGTPPELHDCYGPSGIAAAAGAPRVRQTLKVLPGLKEVIVIGQRGDTLRGSIEMYDSPVMFIYMKCKRMDLGG